MPLRLQISPGLGLSTPLPPRLVFQWWSLQALRKEMYGQPVLQLHAAPLHQSLQDGILLELLD